MAHPEVVPDISSHTPGVHKGEEEAERNRPIGSRRAAKRTRTSRDATSINADKRAPIDPRMPNLPPA